MKFRSRRIRRKQRKGDIPTVASANTTRRLVSSIHFILNPPLAFSYSEKADWMSRVLSSLGKPVKERMRVTEAESWEMEEEAIWGESECGLWVCVLCCSATGLRFRSAIWARARTSGGALSGESGCGWRRAGWEEGRKKSERRMLYRKRVKRRADDHFELEQPDQLPSLSPGSLSHAPSPPCPPHPVSYILSHFGLYFRSQLVDEIYVSHTTRVH